MKENIITIKLLAKYILPAPIYRFLSMVKCNLFLIFGYRDLEIFTADYEQHWKYRIKGEIPKRRIKKLEAISLLLEKDRSVLDLGCGDGAGLEIIKKHDITPQLYGIDISKQAVEECKKRGIEAKQGDVTNIDFIKRLANFDYIILADVIEHTPNPEEIIVALRDKFTRGIIISLPNTGFIQHRVRLLMGKFPMQWDVFPGKHLRFWTYRDFLWWSDKLGFEVKKFIPVIGIGLLKKIWPNLFCEVMIFLLIRKNKTPGG